MTDSQRPRAKGRGSQIAPPNRFVRVQQEEDLEYLDADPDALAARQGIRTEYYPDQSSSIVTENDSPDVGFRYSVNPYRGCAHGCSYCYARPTHEYLGWNAGLDFETRILVKHDAPDLFRRWLNRSSWVPEPIAFSGVTDCYQPAERQFELTRQCLQVAQEARQPLRIITKNALVTRDLDILAAMASERLMHVLISITTLDASLTRVMEPRTSTPAARLRAIEQLSQAGVPTSVMIAPVIPGLNDSEIPALLQAARQAGAVTAAYVLLRLPLSVQPVFIEWLERTQALRKDKILHRIQQTRGGQLNSSQFRQRMRGEGEMADQIAATFRVFAARTGLDQTLPELDTSRFRPPRPAQGQLRLF